LEFVVLLYQIVYLTSEISPRASITNMKTLRKLAMDYYLHAKVLYKKSSDGILLRCFNGAGAKKALQKAHEGICATHASGHMTTRQI